MKVTEKDLWLTAVALLISVVVGLGLSAVTPSGWKVDVALALVTVAFTAFYCLLRFPAIAPKLHRNLVKNLGLKTDH